MKILMQLEINHSANVTPQQIADTLSSTLQNGAIEVLENDVPVGDINVTIESLQLVER